MSKLLSRLFLLASLTLYSTAQQATILHVRGHITDATTHRDAAGASISAATARHSATTDANGFFSLDLREGVKPGDDVRIHIEKEGYRADDVTEAASENVIYPIKITPLNGHKTNPPPQPTRPTFSEAPEFHISAGTVWTTITKDNKKGYSTCLVKAGECLAQGYVENDKLMVNATLFSDDNSPVKVEGNVLYKENPEWDRCFNETALEVVDTETCSGSSSDLSHTS